MIEHFHRELTVAATVAQAWAVLTDVSALTGWISIVSTAEQVAYLERYRAVLEDQMGPFRLRADLDITVTEVHPEARVTVIARGEDRQVGSRITVKATMALAANPNGTTLTLEGQYEVNGRIASLGTAAIKKKAQIILDEFVHHAGVELHMAGTSPT